MEFKLHMHDACSSQSFHMEPLDSSFSEDDCERMQRMVTDYFARKEIGIRFLENRLDFVIIQP